MFAGTESLQRMLPEIAEGSSVGENFPCASAPVSEIIGRPGARLDCVRPDPDTVYMELSVGDRLAGNICLESIEPGEWYVSFLNGPQGIASADASIRSLKGVGTLLLQAAVIFLLASPGRSLSWESQDDAVGFYRHFLSRFGAALREHGLESDEEGRTYSVFRPPRGHGSPGGRIFPSVNLSSV